jgi:hypothetical protein
VQVGWLLAFRPCNNSLPVIAPPAYTGRWAAGLQALQ